MTAPFGGLGVANRVGASPTRRERTRSSAAWVVNTWNSSATTSGVNSSSALMLSSTNRPRPCVATTRSCERLTNFTSYTGTVGNSAFRGFQVAPASREYHSPTSLPSTRKPRRLGSSRTTCTAASPGRPRDSSVHVFPASLVLYTYGCPSSSSWRSSARYAVAASNGETPIWYTRPSTSAGTRGKCPATFDHVFPPSRVSCTKPSSVPTQMVFGSVGATLTVRMVL